MQSEAAGFALGAATWRTGQNIRVVFDLGTFDVISTGSTLAYCTAIRRGPSHGQRWHV